MRNSHRLVTSLTLGLALHGSLQAEQPAAARDTVGTAQVAVLTDDQVVRLLDETVDWYRTLGIQQQSVSQPSDVIILYANRQTADKVVNIALDIARANAELLSSAASKASVAGNTATSPQTLTAQQQSLETQRARLQTEIDSARRGPAAAGKGRNAGGTAKSDELQAELDMVNARRNLLDTMTQFVNESDAALARVNALKAHIEAIAVSLPAANTASELRPTAAAVPGAGTATQGVPSVPQSVSDRSSGIWDLAVDAYDLTRKHASIEAIDRRTASLEQTFRSLQSPSIAQLKEFSARSDALAAAADHATGIALKGVRDRLDTLAWLFKQTSDILIPLSEEGVLLSQYRHNLSNWRDAIRRDRQDALAALALRLGLLAIVLAMVFVGGEIWRRAVIRYAKDGHRRYQLLLLQRVTIWTLVLLITGMTLITHLSTFATFAGLLTAGAAVALQSVLVSVVGYFFLIGKYGIRVGDRVQIGAVTGEVIDLGLVRMHLMELNPQGPLGPTGRVVDFANSIVFQSSGGLFKQIAGVNLSWAEITLQLPPDSDYMALQGKLLASVSAVVAEYQTDILHQTKAIETATASTSVGTPTPQVQLQIRSGGVESVIRYPVPLQQAAEVQQRISRELLGVLAACRTDATSSAQNPVPSPVRS
jgi:hypothetical protein